MTTTLPDPVSRRLPTALRTAALSAALFAAAGAEGLHAQTRGSGSAPAPEAEAPARGSVHGGVEDAETGRAVAGAAVVLEPESAGAFPGAAGGAFLTTARTAVTDRTGRYRFDELAPGTYRIFVSALGYRPYSVVVELEGGAASVSIGLEAAPIALEPVHGQTRGSGPYVAADPFGTGTDVARLLAADLRRRRFLTTDVRELTRADVLEGVTLGEPDVFRALQRLPGVTTRSDYTAELWTRGAPWSHTRVYYDGVPVFNPLHALGVLSGIGSSALGTVWFYPGIRPVGVGAGAAGVIDLRSRPGTGGGEVNLQGDASLLSAGVALDQRVLGGRAGWMVSARRSHIDWFSELASRATDREETFPYGFVEVTGQADVRVTERHTLEGSWLWEGDELRGGESSYDPMVAANWGNALGRLTWTADLGGHRLQHTVAGSGHYARIHDRPNALLSPDDLGVGLALYPLGESLVQYAGVRGSLWPEPRSLSGPDWTVGWALEQHGVDYYGPQPLPVPRLYLGEITLGAESPPLGTVVDTIFTSWNDALVVGSLWAERSWTPTDRLSVRGGLRLEGGPEIHDAGSVRLSPRASIRYSPIPELAISAGAGRVWQYSQAVAPAGVHLASLVTTDAWVLAGPRVPALRADHLTAGLEAWVAPGRSVALNGFVRRSAGVVVPEPSPGPVFGSSRYLVSAENLATGLEATVRQLSGPLTGSVAYSLSRSRTRFGATEFVASSDRTHVLSATAMARPIPPLRIGAAFTAATGVPFTRTVSTREQCATVPGCDSSQLPWAGTPNAERAPPFASLDLLVDWTTRIGELQVGVYGQLRNALGRENATVYTGTGSGCLIVGCSSEALRNTYERGLPRLPVIGIHVRR